MGCGNSAWVMVGGNQVSHWSAAASDKYAMSIRQLLFAAAFAVSAAALPAAAQVGPPPGAAPAIAAAPGTPISLAEVLRAARENFDVSLARRALAVARADITAANHAPAPVLSAKAASIDLQNGIGAGSPSQKRIDTAVGLDWTFERGNKRELRTLAAQRTASAAEADVDSALVEQQLAAGAAFFDLLAAQERVAEVGAISQSADELASTAARRVRAGDLAAQDASRTEIEARRAAADVLGAELERQRAALALSQLTGVTGAGTLRALPDWPTGLAADAQAGDASLYPLVEARADVRAAQRRLEAAQAALDVASAQRKADITIGTSFDRYPGVSNRLLEVRAQMPLYGVFGGYNFQGEIARAEAQIDQAQSLLDKTRQAADIDLQRLRQSRQAAASRALSYDTEIVPRARKLAEMAELAYSKGAMSLTELIDARRTLRATLLEALAARAEHAKAAHAWQLRLQP